MLNIIRREKKLDTYLALHNVHFHLGLIVCYRHLRYERPAKRSSFPSTLDNGVRGTLQVIDTEPFVCRGIEIEQGRDRFMTKKSGIAARAFFCGGCTIDTIIDNEVYAARPC